MRFLYNQNSQINHIDELVRHLLFIMIKTQEATWCQSADIVCLVCRGKFRHVVDGGSKVGGTVQLDTVQRGVVRTQQACIFSTEHHKLLFRAVLEGF